MKKRNKFIVGFVIVLFLIQFVPDKRTNPPIEEEVSAPTEVRSILKRACYDCHSYETKWPWYSNIVPISWYMINHVNGARKKMNFSTWNLYDSEKKADIKKESWEEAHEGNMPLSSYLRLHPEATLSAQDIATLESWAKAD